MGGFAGQCAPLGSSAAGLGPEPATRLPFMPPAPNRTQPDLHAPLGRRPRSRTQVLAGAVVASGELDALVVATGADTFFGKTMALLGTPQERGHLQTVRARGSGGGCWRELSGRGWSAGRGRRLRAGQGASAHGAGPRQRNLSCSRYPRPAPAPSAPIPPPQVLDRVSAALGIVGLAGVAAVFGVLVARGDGVGYAIIVSGAGVERGAGTACWDGLLVLALALAPQGWAPTRCPPIPTAQTAFVIFVSVVPIGMPVVTGAVLAAGAREMAAERAIVSR